MEALVLFAGLVIARVATFVSVLPIFGDTTPRMVRIGLAIAISGLYLLCLPPSFPAGSILQYAGHASYVVYGIALAREAVLGALLGYAFNLLLVPARIAGAFLSQQLGLTFGELVGVTSGAGSGPLTQIFEAMSVLLLLGLDVHHTFFTTLHASFGLYPIGGGLVNFRIEDVTSAMAIAEQQGITLAAPVALCLFLLIIVLTLLTRAAPALNLYSIGFPMQLTGGLAAMLLLLPTLLNSLTLALTRMQALVPRLW